MVDFFLELIDFNSEVPDYSIIIPIIFLYLFVLWTIVSIWVFFDAKKRFESIPVAILIAILNLFLQFPFLFVYLLIRPHSQEDFDDWIDGGVNVPVVNFTGPEGVEMSFELRVFPKRLATDKDAEMRIDVSFDSEDAAKSVVSPKPVSEKKVMFPTQEDSKDSKDSEAESAESKPVVEAESKLTTLVRSINGRLRTIKSKLIEKVPTAELVAEKAKKDKEQKPGQKSDEGVNQDAPSTQPGEPADEEVQRDQWAKKKKKKKKRKERR
ncbi:MAG: hypothetical protein ACE5DX_00340 [Candidatus Dojkabacteria bacterium]